MKKKFDIATRVKELLTEDSGSCSPKKHCAFLRTVIEAFDGKRPGICAERPFNLKTGKMNPNTMVVLFVPGGQYAVLSCCPFCGESLETRKKK